MIGSEAYSTIYYPTGIRPGGAAIHSPPDKPGQKGRVRGVGAIADTARTATLGIHNVPDSCASQRQYCTHKQGTAPSRGALGWRIVHPGCRFVFLRYRYKTLTLPWAMIYCLSEALVSGIMHRSVGECAGRWDNI